MEQHVAAARQEDAVSAMAQLGGKYLTLKLAREASGLEILAVREIIGLMEITRVPRVPEFIRVGKAGERVVFLLDIAKVLSGAAAAQPTQLARTN